MPFHMSAIPAPIAPQSSEHSQEISAAIAAPNATTTVASSEAPVAVAITPKIVETTPRIIAKPSKACSIFCNSEVSIFVLNSVESISLMSFNGCKISSKTFLMSLKRFFNLLNSSVGIFMFIAMFSDGIF